MICRWNSDLRCRVPNVKVQIAYSKELPLRQQHITLDLLQDVLVGTICLITMSKQQIHLPSPACPPALTSATVQLHYLAEGAANVIYSVTVTSPTSLLDHMHCCVIRLRKDLSFTKPAREVVSDFDTRIVPLFGSAYRGLLMEQALYTLTPEMVEAANRELREMDDMDLSAIWADQGSMVGKKIRPSHRRHAYLPSYEDEQYGILMPNLQGLGTDWLVEFKPKWLIQSPSAPKDATNCRTCALNSSRRKAGKHVGRGDSGFCPFDLLADEGQEDVLRRALENIWPVNDGFEKFVVAFRNRVQPALRHLQALQKRYCAVGLDDFLNPLGIDFGLAMALRDCSIFLALKRCGDSKDVEVADIKFADLDLKTTEGGKIQKWAAMERELLDGGWYFSAEGVKCSLSRVNR